MSHLSEHQSYVNCHAEKILNPNGPLHLEGLDELYKFWRHGFIDLAGPHLGLPGAKHTIDTQ